MTSVSVVIATWNRSVLLDRAIRSALCQTHPPIEVLVCDDGSTDDSEQVVRSFCDNRLIWLPGERSGRPAIPRNRGIHASRGSWIAFLDDDDNWLPKKIELQLERLKVSGRFASCTDAFRCLPDEGRQGCLLGYETDTIRFDDLLDDNQIICSSVLVSSVALKLAGGFPESSSLRVVEDYALWLRLLTMSDFAVVAQPLLEYSDNPQESIRKDGPAWSEQKRFVFNDFCVWAESRGYGYLSRVANIRLKCENKKTIMDCLVGYAQRAVALLGFLFR